ncbi:MAG: efflux RND transporter periplasmic adaptor subunit [Bacteroidetes bacterium]|nr:efflux RND transporter periplasmic adaptor subunit [Bacteroidota bacterium]
MKMKYPALMSAFIIFLLNACETKNTDPPKKDKVCISDTLQKMIHIDTVKNSNIDDELVLSGEIGFDENKVVKVFPFSSGQVLEVKASLGDKVKQGQVLAVIKSADIVGSYSDLSAAQRDESIARRQMDNEESLFKNGIASEKEYNEAKLNFEKASSLTNKIKEQIAINGRGNTEANGTYTIRAPREGFIVEKKINTGSFIRQDNTENLFTISDLKNVWVWANVYEIDISKIKLGYAAVVNTLAYPDKSFTGEVDKISDVLDPQTKVMRIRVNLPNASGLLKPEMFANVKVTNKEGKKAVSIPSSALVFSNSKNYVVIYKDTCDLKVQEVSVLKNVNGISYISSGLQVGDKVISDNQILLYNALIE